MVDVDSLKKANFIVSDFEEIWIKDARNIVVTDPYLYEYLKNKNSLKNYDSVEKIKPAEIEREVINSELNFLDKKHELLREEVILKLKKFHKNSLTTESWKKLISLSLLRHIKFCYDTYSICEKYLDLSKHSANILAVESFHIPVDFNSHRQYYQHSSLGSEQLFSIYCELFYPNTLKQYQITNLQSSPKNIQLASKVRQKFYKKFYLKSKQIFRFNFFKRYFLDILRKWVRINIVVFNCSFSKKQISNLELKSFGKIAVINLPNLIGSKTEDLNLRSIFDQYPSYFDRFDKYVFATLKYALPLSLLENFAEIESQANDFFDIYPYAKWAVSEWWIGDSTTSFFLAIASQRKIKHLYPEHNYIAYPFLGNNLRHIYPLTDLFVSTGWKNPNQSNHISGGSMYPWIEIEKGNSKFNVCKQDLLFISSIPLVKAPEINCSYGESGSKMVLTYLEINRNFFNSLHIDIIKNIAYLPYPKSYSSTALTWDQSFYLNKFMKNFKFIIDDETPAKLLMKKVKLTIINYLSTSYLEALMINIPVIVLWRKESQLLNLEHQFFFDELIEVGIFQDNPINAAIFVNKIFDDPYIWWSSSKVQNARKKFLNKNLKKPEVLRNIILGLLKK